MCAKQKSSCHSHTGFYHGYCRHIMRSSVCPSVRPERRYRCSPVRISDIGLKFWDDAENCEAINHVQPMFARTNSFTVHRCLEITSLKMSSISVCDQTVIIISHIDLKCHSVMYSTMKKIDRLSTWPCADTRSGNFEIFDDKLGPGSS